MILKMILHGIRAGFDHEEKRPEEQPSVPEKRKSPPPAENSEKKPDESGTHPVSPT